ncbi:unnamed protein product [Oncorhynchus mykiss]|uniref:Uncharacterized protein n=1 Tax=Oncorhynchus mykiss TaxID=8022 RepID=A0A061A6D3_ONCMY|nr:unnamed protein product [Oncorhynchus mykiss]
MPNEEERQEYVMNENGYIYQEESGDGRQWYYGQFVEGILDACIKILDDSHMPLVNRGDAVKVCRIGSAMMNSQDDRGVLVGNWSDDYSLGTAPTFWIGSDQILLQYVNKGPVSFAQCWVYAGTFNTCECLIKFPFHFQCPPHNIGHVSSKLPVICTEGLMVNRKQAHPVINCSFQLRKGCLFLVGRSALILQMDCGFHQYNCLHHFQSPIYIF